MRDQRERTGWKLVQWAATAAFAVQVVAIGATLGTSREDWRLTLALVPFGFALLRGLVAYGAWYRSGWALWAGGTIALLTVLFTPVLLFVTFTAPAGTVSNTPLSVALGALQFVFGTAFLAGWVLMLLAARRRKNAAADSDG